MRLEARGIIVRYGERAVLDGLDASLQSGELVGLIGPNGSGKTTLLRVLAGLHLPEAGEVAIDGTPLADLPRDEAARRIAYLEQGGEAHWPMRVDAVVGLGRLPHRRAFRSNDAQDAEAIARAMEATGTATLRARSIATLSGGERMRVLLARALAVEAPLLLADEPVAALDPLHQLRVMELLRASARRGQGVLMVLHDLSLAARFCERLVLIAEGNVVAQGAPEEVLQPPHLRRAYGVEMFSGSADGVPYVLPVVEA